jgi:hypothetical protein
VVLSRSAMHMAVGCTLLFMSKLSSTSKEKPELFPATKGLEASVFTSYRDVGVRFGHVLLARLGLLPSA